MLHEPQEERFYIELIQIAAEAEVLRLAMERESERKSRRVVRSLTHKKKR